MKVQSSEFKVQNCVLFAICCLLVAVSGCGYHMAGSKHLPFKSVTIRPVVNNTYEPKLEDRFHKALSEEFMSEGITLRASNGDISIDAKITTFRLGAIAAIDENVQEQEIIMNVDIRVTDKERVTDFPSMSSPIKITFQSTGTVSDSVAQKERATDKACREIAGEIVGKIILRYAVQ